MQKGELEVKELWEEICFILHGDISPSISEEMYEQKIIQSLEKMGWSRFRKEIILKQSIQLGSAGRIVPDIILKSLHNNQSFVIEVKKPSANIDNFSHKNQLISYMRQLKLEHGVLIGNQIQIYYDGKLNKGDDPILLESINFSESNQNCLSFINLFHKDTFSCESLETYAKERITNLENKNKENELLDLLLSSKYQNKMKEIIAENLHQEWDNEIVNNLLDQITITLSHKKTAQPSDPVTPKYQQHASIMEGELTLTQLFQKEFWEQLCNFAVSSKASLIPRNPTRPQYYCDIRLNGRSDCHISMLVERKKNQISCQLYIPKDKALFNAFYSKKEAIENVLGIKEVEWQEKTNACRIITFYNFNFATQEREEAFEWLLQTANKFKNIFSKL